MELLLVKYKLIYLYWMQYDMIEKKQDLRHAD